MPESIKPLWNWEKVRNEAIPEGVPLYRAALAKEFPATADRIKALFGWFGSGEGPWTGFGSYETIPEALLLDFGSPDLVAAAQTENLTEAQSEGAARLFSGWSFSRDRADDLKTLPVDLKKKLLNHVLKTSDKDKLARAKQAFSSS